MSRIRKKKWLGIGLAVVMGLSIAASDMGIMTAFATGNKTTTTTSQYNGKQCKIYRKWSRFSGYGKSESK